MRILTMLRFTPSAEEIEGVGEEVELRMRLIKILPEL